MRRMVFGLVAMLTLAIGQTRAASILYFTDLALGSDRLAAALTSPAITGSHTVTTSPSLAAFTTSASSGAFDILILAQQNFATDAAWDAAWAAVAGQITAGKSAIGQDWTRTPGHGTPFQTSFPGPTNRAAF